MGRGTYFEAIELIATHILTLSFYVPLGMAVLSTDEDGLE